jgi:N-acetyl sugar amidotransferase
MLGVKYCKRCVMNNQRPGIYFDEKGICSGCISEEKKDHIDWDARKQEFEELCSKYRKNNYEFDCVIAVSGGKDSHYQVHVMKEIMGMNPLLVSVEDNFTMTEAGKHNIRNISEEFGCDIITIKPNIKTQKRMMKYCFEIYAKPTYCIDVLIYSFPLWIAIKFGIPLVIYGENTSYEYGGCLIEETPSARNQIKNGAANGINLQEFIDIGIPDKELHFMRYPSDKELNKIDPRYLSYYFRWNDYENYVFAKSRGFKDLTGEWRRTHHIDDYTQVDSMAYGVHYWLKYPKFGHQYATDLASRFIKVGLLTREEGIELVRKHDHKLDQKCVDDFCDFCGYSLSEFWRIVDIFYNRDLFKKDKWNRWILKNPIWKKDKIMLF